MPNKEIIFPLPLMGVTEDNDTRTDEGLKVLTGSPGKEKCK